MKLIRSAFLLLCFLFSLIYAPMTFAYSKEALLLWFEKLVPSMLVTMVLTRMLYETQLIKHLPVRCFCRLFHLSKDAMTLVLCALFLGFPAASQFLDEQCHQGSLFAAQTKRLLYICCFPTCGFVIVTCGSVLLSSVRCGFLLYAAQIFSACFMLFFTRFRTVDLFLPFPAKTIPLFSLFTSSLKQSGITLYLIGGYLMMFMSLSAVILQLLPEDAALPLRIFAEFSSGCTLLSELPLSLPLKLLCINALLSFGGVCVHMQIFSMLCHTKLSYRIFLLFRLLQILLSSLFLFLFFLFTGSSFALQ